MFISREELHKLIDKIKIIKIEIKGVDKVSYPNEIQIIIEGQEQ